MNQKTLVIFFISAIFSISTTLACSEVATNVVKNLDPPSEANLPPPASNGGQQTVDPNKTRQTGR